MAFDLCQEKQAKKPYYIESISTNIYSLEELCFYLNENIYLIDGTIVNEVLCDWIRDELGLKKLYRQLYEQLDKQEGIAYFIIPIFREAGYLSAAKLRELQEKLGKLEVQPGDMRQKMKADYLVKCGMYGNSIHEYYQILERKSPGNLGAQFYAEIWNNLGCAYARMFQFEAASECFFEAWKQVKTREMMRKYVSTLSLFMPQDTYRKKLKELGADPYLISRILEYNVNLCRSLEKEETKTEWNMKEMLVFLEDQKEAYRRNSKV